MLLSGRAELGCEGEGAGGGGCLGTNAVPSPQEAEIFPGPEVSDPAPSGTGGRDEGVVNFHEEDD